LKVIWIFVSAKVFLNRNNRTPVFSMNVCILICIEKLKQESADPSITFSEGGDQTATRCWRGNPTVAPSRTTYRISFTCRL